MVQVKCRFKRTFINIKKVIENWFCKKIIFQAKFCFKRTFINIKKSKKIGSVIRSRFRLNSVSNGLSLILKKPWKIGFITKSWFKLIFHPRWNCIYFKKVRITIFTRTIILVFPNYLFFAFKISHKNFRVFNKISHISRQFNNFGAVLIN